MVDCLLERGDVDGSEIGVFAQVFYGEDLVLQPAVAVGGPLQRFRGLFRIVEQLRPAMLQGLPFLFIVPAHDKAAGVVASRAVVLFMPIPVLYQTLDGDGAVEPFEGFLAVYATVPVLLD